MIEQAQQTMDVSRLPLDLQRIYRQLQQSTVCRSGMQKVNDTKVRSELMSTATLNVTEYGPGHVFHQNREQEVPRCERLLSV